MGSSASLIFPSKSTDINNRSETYLTQGQEFSETLSDDESDVEFDGFPDFGYENSLDEVENNCAIGRGTFVSIINGVNKQCKQKIEEAEIISTYENGFDEETGEPYPNRHILEAMISRGSQIIMSQWCAANMLDAVNQIALVKNSRNIRTGNYVDGVVDAQKYLRKVDLFDDCHNDEIAVPPIEDSVGTQA
mmetsp:Transcript_16828/g.25303  ORF Transcript_16828/g.25303 Transcript_16828/m.25303 type:complete len:191 (+) Transcript_16828:68-640(+)|eukprot:CAMPEP_0185030950 /NCGR_PEP_ID=MMETSP1103-20130426/18117_1 /TAXON_ID=36769 /ORGANISM="Paraphysomonas bandaiensis, Strain Caron Lab Isolate" /LENGTH=190 /DNA_ID=CAMNT_0027566267 /DNA_START=14 /DNA_END=586 /DNA_ORIENTATION=-